MISQQTGKYVHIRKLCNKNKHLEMLAIDKIPPIFNIINNNLMQKKSINCKNTYNGF